MEPIREICLATTNKRKLQELKEILSSLPITLRSLYDFKEIDDEPVEDGKSFAENAIIKANYYYDLIKTPVLADDSGLCVPLLGGKPGLFSKRWADNGKDYQVSFARIKAELTKAGVQEPKNIPAFYHCSLAWRYGEHDIKVFEGELHGKLDFDCRGTNGFGYDPIFIAKGSSRRLAEMPLVEKSAISHRRLAINKFTEFIT
jgi:XTP/dITP diphosphohydrolase